MYNNTMRTLGGTPPPHSPLPTLHSPHADMIA